jgi:hypothetical protein
MPEGMPLDELALRVLIAAETGKGLGEPTPGRGLSAMRGA